MSRSFSVGDGGSDSINASSSSLLSGGDFTARQQQQQGEGVLPQAVVDYLMPPQEANPEVDSQVGP